MTAADFGVLEQHEQQPLLEQPLLELPLLQHPLLPRRATVIVTCGSSEGNFV